MKQIYLIGFMGAGKTTVGEILAKKMNRFRVDTDRYIEEDMGCTIPEIFSRYGEEFFRDKETETLKEISRRAANVVSCGGGMPLREENILLMKQSGIVVYLKGSCETLYKRLKDDEGRPLLAGTATEKRVVIERLLEERSVQYEAVADYIIDIDGRDVYEVAEEIEKQLL